MEFRLCSRGLESSWIKCLEEVYKKLNRNGRSRKTLDKVVSSYILEILVIKTGEFVVDNEFKGKNF